MSTIVREYHPSPAVSSRDMASRFELVVNDCFNSVALGEVLVRPKGGLSWDHDLKQYLPPGYQNSSGTILSVRIPIALPFPTYLYAYLICEGQPVRGGPGYTSGGVRATKVTVVVMFAEGHAKLQLRAGALVDRIMRVLCVRAR